MWRNTPGGVTDWSSKFLDTSVTGSMQHAQCDSSRTVLSLNGGMCENATASLAQPTKEWNSSSMYARTCDGNDENGGAFSRLQFCVSSLTTTSMPSWSSLYAAMIRRRSSCVAWCTSSSVGPRPCSHQNSNTNARTCLARSENSNSGTFCGMNRRLCSRSRQPLVEHDLVVRVAGPDAPRVAQRDRGGHDDIRRFSGAAQRPGRDPVAVVTGEPQPVVVAPVEARNVERDLGTRGARVQGRRRAHPGARREHDPAPGGGATGHEEHERHDRRGDRGRRRGDEGEPAARSGAASGAFRGNPAEDAFRQRGRRLAEAAAGPPRIGERQRGRDRGQLPQLGPAFGTAVEVGAQREGFGRIGTSECHGAERGAQLATRTRRHRTNPTLRVRAALPSARSTRGS